MRIFLERVTKRALLKLSFVERLCDSSLMSSERTFSLADDGTFFFRKFKFFFLPTHQYPGSSCRSWRRTRCVGVSLPASGIRRQIPILSWPQRSSVRRWGRRGDRSGRRRGWRLEGKGVNAKRIRSETRANHGWETNFLQEGGEVVTWAWRLKFSKYSSHK